jgi:hypothetical protein
MPRKSYYDRHKNENKEAKKAYQKEYYKKVLKERRKQAKNNELTSLGLTRNAESGSGAVVSYNH